MNSVDSTLEDLALHYVGIGLFSVVNNVWTLVALVTATVSYWRLRGAVLLLHLPYHSRPVGSLHERESTSESINSGPELSIRESVAVPALSLDTETAAVEEEEEAGNRSVAGEWWEKAWRMRRKGAEKVTRGGCTTTRTWRC